MIVDQSVYLIGHVVLQLALLGGGAYLTVATGQWPWIAGAVALAAASSYGATQRMNSWGNLGKV